MQVASPSGSTDTDRALHSLRQGIDWLIQQQAADGGWHSQTYGQMRCGVGDTALVVYALSHVPEELRRGTRSSVRRGIRFLIANLDEQGFVRAPDSSADYPTYATALLFAAMERLAIEEWSEQRFRMQWYLRLSRQTGRQGWSPNDPDFGGWNHTGDGDVEAKLAGQTNVSVTCFALEALQATNALDDDTRTATLRYLARCQNFGLEHDGNGGFCFTPVPDDPLNKAGVVEGAGELCQARSYGTATADGLCALLACGVSPRDARVQAALDWLERQQVGDFVPGISDDEAHVQFREGLKFYYYAALARVMRQVLNSMPLKHRFALLATLIQQQHSDGSWSNPCQLMREDDPLVATALAVAATAILTSAR